MSERKEFRELVPPEEAHEAIASLDVGGGTEEVPLREARGRVLAQRVDATLDVPGFDRASMDGYAVRARDTFGAGEADPVVLELSGAVHAGEEPEIRVEEGACAEISTGAVMPEGADAVVMVERTDEVENGIEIRTSLAPGDHVMLAGADVAAGERALGPGTQLTSREIGLLSALGVDSVPVRAKPRVGIVSTGDELVRPGEAVASERGQIYDVNSYTVATAVEEAGGEAVLYPHAGDDYEEMERILTEAAAECDLVLSSGSTSASAVDVIYRVIEDQGELLLHGVAIKPGKPMLVGEFPDSAYVGLPGYPVSALMIFRHFVAGAIRRAAGVPEPPTATVEAEMAVEERYEEGRTRLMPVGILESRGRTLAYPVDKGSGATTSLVEADGIVEVDSDTAYLDPGEPVSVTLFSPDVRPPTVFGVGEDDPTLSNLLDDLDRPRYLAIGGRQGRRRLAQGVPDFAVVTGGSDDIEATELGAWTREWGLVVGSGNPEGIEGLSDLVDRELRFVNRPTDAGLRTTLSKAIEQLAAARGESRTELVERIDGFELAARAQESPARKVAAGGADAGLGLRSTAEKLDLDFVALGEERVRVLANPDRVGKRGVEALKNALANVDPELPGVGR
ncbi:molybdopterin biosynthesis protein [Halalkalicoccus jeotgali]|uniref:Molybdopterin biosynthesis protein MoeA/LysR substrate binding-domain-containing protein n=1 Tax=Halalkalicoccus jeotgali (strain DSM 18796 / CECT 7217 / JCM 14584 / KCTC 4019 / B3) TaxID=795797 RepID=D8JA87_HALJB|nr:molybdopterin biosynthesis protein [Halalkalicoccus jeotgali]ADJ14609.1 putative molybdopterin biosynthesis protein MoeA/LysR substrate binding-domain-containing protein [Halalkalicoccus jeotgali B3]ELY39982.1 molybdopterin biosynthesis protein MoeA/LysR substrate binding-domain-containing protein [Halalkalicoccus jeotgali B3]